MRLGDRVMVWRERYAPKGIEPGDCGTIMDRVKHEGFYIISFSDDNIQPKPTYSKTHVWVKYDKNELVLETQLKCIQRIPKEIELSTWEECDWQPKKDT